MGENSEYTKLPSGWDCKYDKSTGKCYYINYITKAMQLEDPRNRYRPLQNEKCSVESIPLQSLHGSPYHVYPTSSFPVVKAFQGPNLILKSACASPLLSTKSQMEISPILRQGSLHSKRVNSLTKFSDIQETSFTNQNDIDAIVFKINNMFPTASETHIRLLLKKYYNREAVVISALQVEKHPLTMPGPFATPPAQRHLFHSNSGFQVTPVRRFDGIQKSGSPIPKLNNFTSGDHVSPKSSEMNRSSPKPHSSPKMKLRYLKNVFPKADETLLLDILANADNNVQEASESLLALGYIKRDVSVTRFPHRFGEKEKYPKIDCKHIASSRPKQLTKTEKAEILNRLQTEYANVAERIILMALDSVNYSEERAIQILQIVQQEDENKAKKQAEEKVRNLEPKEITKAASPLKRNSSKECVDSNTNLNDQIEFISTLNRITIKGHNANLCKGPDDNLLLADYVTWNGANPEMSVGRRVVAVGSDHSLIGERNYAAHGCNKDLCKGPEIGLAKGSIYSKINRTLIGKCN